MQGHLFKHNPWQATDESSELKFREPPRWFVLDREAGVLRYWSSKEDWSSKGKPRRAVDVRRSTVTSSDAPNGRPRLSICSINGRVYTIEAETAAERDQWVDALCMAAELPVTSSTSAPGSPRAAPTLVSSPDLPAQPVVQPQPSAIGAGDGAATAGPSSAAGALSAGLGKLFSPSAAEAAVRAAASASAAALQALDDRPEVLEEVFENQRCGSRSSGGRHEWGSDFPGHLHSKDPPAWTNRLHEPLSVDGDELSSGSGPSSRVRRLAYLSARPGWEWVDEWRVDRQCAPACCDAHGWMYAVDFPALLRQLLERRLPAGLISAERAALSGDLPTRWRRWVRVRRHAADAVTAGIVTATVNAASLAIGERRDVRDVPEGEGVGGWGVSAGTGESHVPESHILFEGWLSKYHSTSVVPGYHVLLRGADGRSAALLECRSAEDTRFRMATHCPTAASFATTEHPPLTAELARVIAPDVLGTVTEPGPAFGLGSDVATEGTLYCAPTAVEAHFWRQAFARAMKLVPSAMIPPRPRPPPTQRRCGSRSRPIPPSLFQAC